MNNNQGLLKLADNNNRGPGYWKLNCTLIEEPECIDGIVHLINGIEN